MVRYVIENWRVSCWGWVPLMVWSKSELEDTKKPLRKCEEAFLFRGRERIRTAVQGFADLCLATRPRDHYFGQHCVSEVAFFNPFLATGTQIYGIFFNDATPAEKNQRKKEIPALFLRSMGGFLAVVFRHLLPAQHLGRGKRLNH